MTNAIWRAGQTLSLLNFDRIQTDSCKFPTNRIMVAQNFNSIPKIWLFSPIFSIFKRKFSDKKKISENFTTGKNIGWISVRLVLSL